MFTEITETFSELGRGVHGYKAISRIAWAKAGDRQNHAATWAFLALLADDFVERCERMPVSSQELQDSFDAFLRHVAAFNAANSDAATLLASLDAAARELANRKSLAS
ncbi:hypothetical protein [Rhodobacter sp. 24-YEA-8]|uniref:hypothetical protein n=1 Tax=Rhodobacter sp. 24-YEA-8 TaxID=1884310 RepID=UPI000898D00A|nr:hypothetical protein [Rhodobacter sp. 24-YEA-8]SED62796.1 hypothetical protein SAMN05519105_4306 [Rhodobacter sp. 24-YEA-8]